MQPMRSKQGRVALVTGAAQGLGYAFAARLAAEGAIVVAADRTHAPQVTDEFRAAGAADAVFQQTDVAEESQVIALTDMILSRFGQCDIVVNNAGISPRGTFEATSLADWRHTMAVNVESAFLTCRGLVPRMKQRGYGRIVNVASDTLGLTLDGFSHYMASKGAVVGLTRALANDFGVFGITANCIAPGLTKTPNTLAMFPDGKLFDELAAMQPIKRPAMPDDLVGAMSFLTSEDAGYFTGQTMVVDGGMLKAL